MIIQIYISNMEYQNISKKLEKMYDISFVLYKEAKKENNSILDPVNWINNQNQMRKSWEEFIEPFKNNESMRKVMLNNSFGAYMNFMYKSYPSGFGDELRKGWEKGTSIDGTLIYIKLKEIN